MCVFAKIVETQTLATHLNTAHGSSFNLEHVCGWLVGWYIHTSGTVGCMYVYGVYVSVSDY